MLFWAGLQAARLGLSTLVTVQDFLVVLTATQDFAVERLQYARAVLLGDMTSMSSDVSGFLMPTSLKMNLSVILQRLMSLATIQVIQNEINMDGFLMESIMIQIAVNESYRSLRTYLIASDDYGRDKDRDRQPILAIRPFQIEESLENSRRHFRRTKKNSDIYK